MKTNLVMMAVVLLGSLLIIALAIVLSEIIPKLSFRIF